MQDTADHFLSDLTTSPIFDDSVYLSEALQVPQGQNEEDLDSLLAVSARESGIEDPHRFLSPDVPDTATAMSALTVSSEQTDSLSLHSRETQSTGMTSHPSRTSKEHPARDLLTIPSAPSQPTRTSLSLDTYDAVMNRFRPLSRHRRSPSAASGATSIFSTTSSLPQPAQATQTTQTTQPISRKHRRTGLFSMFRRGSSSCPSRAHHGHQSKALTPTLGCGHKLSASAIRIHIQEALENKDRMGPNCCGKPLPRSVLEILLTKEEAQAISNDASRSPGLNSNQDSGYSEDGISALEIPHAVEVRPGPPESIPIPSFLPSCETTQSNQDSLIVALANEACVTLRSQQKEQFRRVASFESSQRKALIAYHQSAMKRLNRQFEMNKVQMAKQHPLELERLDEAQLVAEHDLRKVQAQETQNVATALKYMEAYCSGRNPANPENPHEANAEDFRKLARQYYIQQNLPAKHESQVNVLRAKQERETRARLQKQNAALRQLDADLDQARQAAETQHLKDLNQLDTVIHARRQRLMHRWDLQYEIWRRDWEHQHGLPLDGRLPHEAWPEASEVDSTVNPTSSLALYLQVAA